MMTHEQKQQTFSEDSDDEFWGFKSILLILVHLYAGSTPGWFIGPKTRCVLNCGCDLYMIIYSSFLHCPERNRLASEHPTLPNTHTLK